MLEYKAYITEEKMNIITIEDLPKVVAKLQFMNLKAVAKETGLHYMTIYLIARGKNTSPSYKTVSKLVEFLK